MPNPNQSYLVYGGEVADTKSREFKDPKAIEFIGVFSNYDEAFDAWRGAAQRTVDNAEMRFFIAQIDDIRKVSEEPKG